MPRGGVDGLLLLDKPSGPTSHDMVAASRRLMGAGKAGHTGTLDPLATGLLVIMLDKATKLAPFIKGDPKVYEGCVLLGLTTDTMDIQGEVISEGVYGRGAEPVREAFASLVGELRQLPPMYSAAKFRGKPLYRYARRGEEVPRKERAVRVYSAEVRGFRDLGGRAEADFLIACSPGTYVRELVARVGEMLACGGTLKSLRRTASGLFGVEEAVSVGRLEDDPARRERFLLPPHVAVRGYHRVVVDDAAVDAVRNGTPIAGGMLQGADPDISDGDVVAVFGGGSFLGMHRVSTVSPYASRALRMM